MRTSNVEQLLSNFSKSEIAIDSVAESAEMNVPVKRTQASYVHNEEMVIGFILCSVIPPKVQSIPHSTNIMFYLSRWFNWT